MLGDFIAYVSKDLPAEATYRDPDLELQPRSNEITDQAIDNIRDLFRHYLKPDHPALARWFGRFVSDTKADIVVENRDRFDHFDELLASCPTLARHPASHFAYRTQGDGAMLFIDGNDFDVSAAFAETLCREREFDIRPMLNATSNEERRLLVDLYNQGKLCQPF